MPLCHVYCLRTVISSVKLNTQQAGGFCTPVQAYLSGLRPWGEGRGPPVCHCHDAAAAAEPSALQGLRPADIDPEWVLKGAAPRGGGEGEPSV